MDKNSTLGQVLDTGKNIGTNTVVSSVKTAKNQILGDDEQSPDQKAKLAQNTSFETPQKTEDPQKTAERTREMVADFYAPSEEFDPLKLTPDHMQSMQQADQDKLAKLRSELAGTKGMQGQLHKDTYYDPLFAHEQRKQQQEEERPAEKAEREKMEDLKIDMDKKKKADDDIAVQRAKTTIEINRGVAG